MNASDLYVKLVDPSGKHSDVVAHHRVWDESLFMIILKTRYELAEGDDRRIVEKASQGEYRRAAGYKLQYC